MNIKSSSQSHHTATGTRTPCMGSHSVNCHPAEETFPPWTNELLMNATLPLYVHLLPVLVQVSFKCSDESVADADEAFESLASGDSTIASV